MEYRQRFATAVRHKRTLRSYLSRPVLVGLALIAVPTGYAAASAALDADGPSGGSNAVANPVIEFEGISPAERDLIIEALGTPDSGVPGEQSFEVEKAVTSADLEACDGNPSLHCEAMGAIATGELEPGRRYTDSELRDLLR